MLEINDLQGLWHRSLIVRPDGTRDTSTWVAWLQGPSFFIDLRVTAARPSFAGARCRKHLTAAQLAWLGQQEGFAGRLEREGDFFVWRREIDFQPQSVHPDAGALRFEDNIMVEEGRDVSYVEHWHREPGPRMPQVAARLRDRRSGHAGFIVRAGEHFMHARNGPSAFLPVGAQLAGCVETAPSLDAAQELVDCEISFGCAGLDGWIIARSSLPYREGAALAPEITCDGVLRTADITPDGASMRREWEVVDLEGDAAAFAAPVALEA